MKSIRRHKLPILLAAIAIIFLLVGLLIPNLNDAAKGFVGNLFAEAVGIFAGSAITIAVIDELLARRARRLNVERARKQTEGLLLDIAARTLWASQNYEPGDLENLSTDYSALEPWRTIINRLSCNSKWHSARLAANDPSPDELTRLSPRIWDIMPVPSEKPPNPNVARKAAIVSACADDFERIANEWIPELIDDLFEARSSSAVITHWVSVLRHSHLFSLTDDEDAFFAHTAGAIWEVLVSFDDAYYAIPHPLHGDEEREIDHANE
jgi:hypothetical protein